MLPALLALLFCFCYQVYWGLEASSHSACSQQMTFSMLCLLLIIVPPSEVFVVVDAVGWCCCRTLLLAGNLLSSSLPSSVAGVSQLQTLDVSNNALVGPMPTAFVGLDNLRSLSLASNFVNGSLGPMNGCVLYLYLYFPLCSSACFALPAHRRAPFCGTAVSRALLVYCVLVVERRLSNLTSLSVGSNFFSGPAIQTVMGLSSLM